MKDKQPDDYKVIVSDNFRKMVSWQKGEPTKEDWSKACSKGTMIKL
jgi:hypothetical protein